MDQKIGCVYLVGAGCGEADLITVRGLSLLRSCDVVVYDDLIAEELLAEAPETAEKLYMGKRLGQHSAKQSEICAVLVAKAQEGKLVVRLKGGDPFVFGRGGEEILALQKASIPYEEVPGISSAIAIPGLAGIPVTHRGVSRSFHVVTAHTADTPDGLPPYMDKLAQLPGTLVFLMGLKQLPAIADRLMAAGMNPETPAAVISGGNSPNPAAVRGTLQTIAASAQAAKVKSPAVITVGGVAALDFSSTVPKPLRGIRIGLTGTQAITEKLRPALQSLGARVFLAERSLVCERPPAFDLHTLCDGRPSWVVFTSSNGVRLFFRRLREQEIDLRRLAACRFAVIGASTGALLKTYGIQADLCPETYTSEALAQALCHCAAPEDPIFLFRSAHGSEALFQTLAKTHQVQDIPLYHLVPDPETERASRSQLGTADYLVFSSASGVELFFHAYGNIPENAACVCIGEVTAKALKTRYDKPFLIAPEISANGILQAILDLQKKRI